MNNLIINPPDSWVKFFEPNNALQLPVKTIAFQNIVTELFTTFYASDLYNDAYRHRGTATSFHRKVFSDIGFNDEGKLSISEEFAMHFEETHVFFEYFKIANDAYFGAVEMFVKADMEGSCHESTALFTRLKDAKILLDDLITAISNHFFYDS